jgi:hypothetical protein
VDVHPRVIVCLSLLIESPFDLMSILSEEYFIVMILKIYSNSFGFLHYYLLLYVKFIVIGVIIGVIDRDHPSYVLDHHCI